MNWEEMTSAPMDGRRLILKIVQYATIYRREPYVTVGRFGLRLDHRDNYWWYDIETNEMIYPDGWMPFPEL